ncbi:MAG TPA: aldehyde dehydrogenase family protein, partial [Myxococcaceae bacterium]|nr:aldehyde dehydrogenase family protein [Myxococcaceae bacterium]
MIDSHPRVPPPTNEPVRAYAPDDAARAELKAAIHNLERERLDIPLLIGGDRQKGEGGRFEVVEPHRHHHPLATVHGANAAQVQRAIHSAMAVKDDWATTPFHRRAAIFLRAADLLATRYRSVVNAATLLGQSKTAYQAEIDAACESIDFLRFNTYFGQSILETQPQSAPQTWNVTDYRPLDGFVFAVAPFNFTAIALNLCTAPALMGNVVLFKPAPAATLSNWFLMEVLREAGL